MRLRKVCLETPTREPAVAKPEREETGTCQAQRNLVTAALLGTPVHVNRRPPKEVVM